MGKVSQATPLINDTVTQASIKNVQKHPIMRISDVRKGSTKPAMPDAKSVEAVTRKVR